MSEAQCVDEYELLSNVSYLHFNQADSTRRSSVISSSQNGSADTTNKDRAVHSEITPKDGLFMYEKQILEKIHLLSETSSVNLMTVPKQMTEQLKNRTIHPNLLPEKVLPIAKLELAFLLSKECVSFWTEYNPLEITTDPSQENNVFIAIQVTKPFMRMIYNLYEVWPN